MHPDFTRHLVQARTAELHRAAQHARLTRAATPAVSQRTRCRVRAAGTVLTLNGGVFAQDVQGDWASTYEASLDGVTRYSV